MRKIVHLSDIHFGTADRAIVELVVDAVNRIDPCLVVISGDLTQRARSAEFAAAKIFIDRLPGHLIVVPGNHDVPAHNLIARFFYPLGKYKRFITTDLSPTFVDGELAVIGINTARSLVIKNGRINNEQIDLIRRFMGPIGKAPLKIVVTHHPFELPDGLDRDDIVGGATEALSAIAQCGGDVLLSGHLHISNIETTAKRYKLTGGRNALVVQAGTAASTRVRGEPNSFNLLTFDDPRLSIERFECMDAADGFSVKQQKSYTRSDIGWKREE